MKSAKTWIILTILAAAGAYAGIALCAAEKSAAEKTGGVYILQSSSRPAELKVLDRWVGEWDCEASTVCNNDKSTEIKMTATVSRKWVLDDQFVQEAESFSDGGKYLMMFGYDQEKKAYRIWRFDSYGRSLDVQGQWDDASQTMTSKIDGPNDISTLVTIHFTDKDTHEWKAVAKDATGKTILKCSEQYTRKK